MPAFVPRRKKASSPLCLKLLITRHRKPTSDTLQYVKLLAPLHERHLDGGATTNDLGIGFSYNPASQVAARAQTVNRRRRLTRVQDAFLDANRELASCSHGQHWTPDAGQSSKPVHIFSV
jgi:hypothetical protein